MTPADLLDELSARGVVVVVSGDSLDIDAPQGTITDDDIETLREYKAELIRWLRLVDGLPVDDDAARLLDCDEIDLDTVPVCQVCGRSCDTITLADSWKCSHCEPEAEERNLRTMRVLLRAEAIRRYAGDRHG